MGKKQHASARHAATLRRVVPLLVLLVGLGSFFALDLEGYLSCDSLVRYNAELQEFAEHAWAPLVFLLFYALAVAFSLPGGAVMTVAGGFMFGQLPATFYVVVAATSGATALFLIAKTAVGDVLRARAGPAVRRMEAGFQENALSYLLVLRLIPLFPFWLVNLVPAFLGVPLRVYVIGTFFGIIPGSFVYASLGAGLGNIVRQGEDCSLSGALTPEVITALVGLAILAILPVVYKRIRKRRAGRDER